MVGGTLEYLSLLTGFRALLFLVAALYGTAYLLAQRTAAGTSSKTTPPGHERSLTLDR
jgi:hypothetical protein